MEPSRPSRSLADWMILAGMFIFLVILSHGQMTTANELKKLNERMGRPAQLGVYPPAVPPPPTAVQSKYEYLVERFQVSCYDELQKPPPHYCNFTSYGSISKEVGPREYADFLTNKSAEGWELFQDTTLSNDINYGNCIFRRRMSWRVVKNLWMILRI